MAAKEYLEALQQPGTVLRDGDFAVVYGFDRWHLLTISLLGDNTKGIHTLHFMSPREAEGFLDGQPAGKKVERFEEVAADFAAEVMVKILQTPEDYVWLAEAGLMDRGGGYTTDTLGHVPFEPALRTEWLQDIADMMREGTPGPYLRFRFSYRKMQGVC